VVAEAQARAYGITGVPFFVVEGVYGVSGAQPAELLLRVLQEASQARTLVPVTGSAPSCDDGSCAV
jgi:predicted DsbA family dithiol-disulfide isomerase